MLKKNTFKIDICMESPNSLCVKCASAIRISIRSTETHESSLKMEWMYGGYSQGMDVVVMVNVVISIASSEYCGLGEKEPNSCQICLLTASMRQCKIIRGRELNLEQVMMESVCDVDFFYC